MSSAVAFCFGSVCFILLVVQGIGIFTPYWIADPNCEKRGLLYQCCKPHSSNKSTAMECQYGYLDTASGTTVVILEGSGFACFLISFIFSILNCCRGARDSTDVSGCLSVTSTIFTFIGAILGFAGGMLIASDGYTSFGFSFWLAIIPGILLLFLIFLLICTSCLACCCGGDCGKPELSTCLKCRCPGSSYIKLLYKR